MNALLNMCEPMVKPRAAMARLPVFLALAGRRAVIAGGSAAAAWKAELVAAAGARVDVYAAEISEEMREVAADGEAGAIRLVRRDWSAADLAGAAIAIGAVDDDAAAKAFCDAARAAGVPVNVIDRPAFCDFTFGAIVNRSPLVIGISTDGAAPVFAQAIRAKLEGLLPVGFSEWARAAARWRAAVKVRGLTPAGRRKFWQLFAARAVAAPDETPRRQDFDRIAAEVKGFGRAIGQGAVTVVSAGPGDPELLTLRAVRALQTADVILHDDHVAPAVLDFARREARKMAVGPMRGPRSEQEAEVGALMVRLAKQGKHVVRLSDQPMAAELAACQASNIAVVMVPGVVVPGVGDARGVDQAMPSSVSASTWWSAAS
jgi:uroporphyrin-III C-methyltransferase / precorrin-2 dehydrogenase / sirohydrochlorin ferrochelatase